MNWALIRKMYIEDHLSTAVIARHLGKAKRTINLALHSMGVELRTKTSLRVCRIPGCGKECFKRLSRNQAGQISLSGGLCYDHQRKRWQEKNLARRSKAVYSKPQDQQQGERTPINRHADESSSSTATV